MSEKDKVQIERDTEAQVVAFLRRHAKNYLDRADQCRHATPAHVREYKSGELLNYAADAIERGEHRKDRSLGDEKEQIVEDLREGAAFLKSGWSWGGIDGRTKLAFCQEVVAEVLEAAANRYERGDHREENEE